MKMGTKLKLENYIDKYMLGGYVFGFGMALLISHISLTLSKISETDWYLIIFGIVAIISGLYMKKHNKKIIYDILKSETDKEIT